MAVRASELLLIVRAQNQASQALKRVATDMRGLTRVRDIAAAQEKLAIRQADLMRQKQRALNEVQSINANDGRRRLALNEATVRNQRQMIEAQDKLNRLERQYRRDSQGRIRTDSGRFASAQNLAALKAAGMRVKELRIAQEKLASTEASLARRTGILNSEIATTTQRMAQLAAQQRALDKAITSARWERVNTVGRTMQHTARVVQMGGLVMGASLLYAGNAAAKFQTQVGLAATQTRDIGASFQQTAVHSKILESSILSMMKQFPATAEEMSKAAYDIYSSLSLGKGQAGVRNGVKLLKLLNQAAVAGQTSLDEVTAATISVMNNFRIGVGGMTEALQTMFAAVRFGRMSFQEFAQMMPSLSPAFAAAGYGLTEMAQAAAFMTRQMPNTARAATSLARLTEILAHKDFIAGAKAMGVEITDMNNRLLPLPTIIDRLAKGFPQLTRAIKSGRGDVPLQNFFKEVTALGSGGKGMTSTIQARRAFTFFVTQLGQAHQIYKQVAKDQDEFTVSLQAMEKTTGVQWSTFVNSLKAFGLELGVTVLPALLRMADGVSSLLKWWDRLDQSTKDQIGTFAAWGAAAALVGSTLLWILGFVTRLSAGIGKMGGAFSVLLVAVLAASAAVSALSGDWDGLNGVIDTFFSLMTGSVWGWVTYFGLAALGTAKLARGIATVTAAYKGMVAVQAVSGAAGMGGLLIGGRRAAGVSTAGAAAVKNASKLKLLVGGIASSIGLAGIGLGTLGIGLGVAAGAAGLWYLHQRGVRQELERSAREAERVKNAAMLALRPAGRVGDLGGNIRDLERAQITVRETKRQIADARQQLNGLTGTERARQLDVIRGLLLDLADAQAVVSEQTHKANAAFNAFQRANTFINENKRLIGKWTAELVTAQRKVDELRADKNARHLIPDIRAAEKDVQVLTKRIFELAAANERAQKKLGVSWTKSIRSLMAIGPGGGGLPKASNQVIKDMLAFSQKIGRMMTRKEMTMFIRASLDKKSLSKVDKDMRDFIKGQRNKRAAADAQKIKDTILIGSSLGGAGGKKAVSNAKKVHEDIVKFYSDNPAKLKIKLPPAPTGRAKKIGEQMAAGINEGMASIPISKTVTIIINRMEKTLEIQSPSKVMARRIGVPMMQGIISGILSKQNELQKVAALTADIFQGEWLQKRTSEIEDKGSKAKKLQMQDLIRDTAQQAAKMKQFNNAIRTLAARGLPRGLLDDLRELGVEGLKYIMMLANATPKELKKFIKAWKDMQKEVKRSQYTSLEDVRQWSQDMRQSIKDMADQAAQNLLDMWNNFKQINEQNFGDMFDGLADKIGQGFEDAMAQYQSDLAGYQNELANLNQQLADAYAEIAERQKQAIEDRAQELQQAMGQLFSGEWLSSEIVQTKLQWGKKLGFDDLYKDLEGQVTRFQRWRTALTGIAAKVPPELAKQLEALGPEAVDNIEILNNATDEELARYIALWQQSQGAIMDIAKDATVDVSDIMERINEILQNIDEVTQKLAELQVPEQLTGQDILDNIKRQMEAWEEYQRLLEELAARGVPAEIIQQLAALGPEALPYLRALLGMTDEQLTEFVALWEEKQQMIEDATNDMMQRQLQMWYEHGANIASALIAGILTEQQALLDFFRELFINLLEGRTTIPNMPDPGDYSGPGSGSGVGPGGGSNPYDYPANDYGPNGPLGLRGSSYALGQSGGTTVNMEVTAVQDESLQSTLERSTFRIKSRL